MKRLEKLIKGSLEEFYRRRSEKLGKLRLTDLLGRKNPYLYRALGVQRADHLILDMLSAFVASSDETIFGDAFFEPIAKIVSGGQPGSGEGGDIQVETTDRITIYSIKSGSSWSNSSSMKMQKQNFDGLRSRLYKTHKIFDPVLCHGYGRKCSDPKGKRIHRILSGQAFWEELTGDPYFYIKLIELMRDYPQKQRKLYQVEWDMTLTRLLREFFALNFAKKSGEIDWERLIRFNSGKEKRERFGKVTVTLSK